LQASDPHPRCLLFILELMRALCQSQASADVTGSYYPVATAAISVSKLCFDEYRGKLSETKVSLLLSEKHAFEEVVCACLNYFDTVFRGKNATYMQFSEVLGEVSTTLRRYFSTYASVSAFCEATLGKPSKDLAGSSGTAGGPDKHVVRRHRVSTMFGRGGSDKGSDKGSEPLSPTPEKKSSLLRRAHSVKKVVKLKKNKHKVGGGASAVVLSSETSSEGTDIHGAAARGNVDVMTNLLHRFDSSCKVSLCHF
jgi:ELMO/CED-12 family